MCSRGLLDLTARLVVDPRPATIAVAGVSGDCDQLQPLVLPHPSHT
jgi:hypothetical protein